MRTSTTASKVGSFVNHPSWHEAITEHMQLSPCSRRVWDDRAHCAAPKSTHICQDSAKETSISSILVMLLLLTLIDKGQHRTTKKVGA